jgi:exodeoxyribonuclease VII large subunit
MDSSGKYSVSELTALIKEQLEGAFPSVVVEGELSNCRPSSTGHLYFTLKDAGAALSGVMFKGRLRSLGFEPLDGMLLRVRGSIDVYPPRGAYQIIAEEMEEAGAGDILAMLEARKRRLADEGLFDEARKRPIPRFPETVAVVSSPTGAAVQDILNILRRRAGGIRVIILPTAVQGPEAAAVITRRIEQAGEWGLADVLIVGRGGGSIEDLLPFSDEAVVRAVAASPIPVISAVGHEIDWALSDFAADLRAPTPSAAAELVSGSRRELQEQAQRLEREMLQHIEARLERIRLLLKPFSTEDLEYRFRSILQAALLRFDDAKEALTDALQKQIESLRRRLEVAVTALESASPLAAMERGFSVVVNTRSGAVLRNSDEARPGDMLEIRPLKGRLQARTETIEEESDGV